MFGFRIKALREEKNLTQKEMSEKIGININTLASYEKGTREPGFETLRLLSVFFECTTDYLLGVSEIPNKFELEKVNTSIESVDQMMTGIISRNIRFTDEIVTAIDRIACACCFINDDLYKTKLFKIFPEVSWIFYDLGKLYTEITDESDYYQRISTYSGILNRFSTFINEICSTKYLQYSNNDLPVRNMFTTQERENNAET